MGFIVKDMSTDKILSKSGLLHAARRSAEMFTTIPRAGIYNTLKTSPVEIYLFGVRENLKQVVIPEIPPIIKSKYIIRRAKEK